MALKMYLFHIFAPMIVSNVTHMILVKKNAFASMAVPIAPALFGANKTWRGVVILPLLNGALFWVVHLFLPLFRPFEAFLYGAILGLAYVLFELPNSWLKRRMGVGAGQKAEKNAWLFMALDKMDSATGVSIASAFIFGLSWIETLRLFFLAVLIHVFFSWLLTALGLKKRF